MLTDLTPIVLVESVGPPFIVWGEDAPPHYRHLTSGDDVADMMAWCSCNRCEAVPFFDSALSGLGGRAWLITPLDDDAALALRLRWL